MENNEFILCAAIHYDDGLKYPHTEIYDIETGFVIAGYRHHNIIAIEPTNPIKFKEKHGHELLEENEGFITSCGRFVNRYKAMEIAYKSGQIIKNKVFNKDGSLNRLFSEDLY